MVLSTAALLPCGASASSAEGPDPARQGRVYFIAPDGEDDADGSKEHPFATIERVQRTIRQLKTNGKFPSGGVTMVDLKAGANAIIAGDSCITVSVARAATPDPAATNAPPAKSPVRKYAKLPYAADKPKAPPKGKRPAEITVVVDPGHGGSDTGALTPRGFMEKDANLRLAMAVRDELGRRGARRRGSLGSRP